MFDLCALLFSVCAVCMSRILILLLCGVLSAGVCVLTCAVYCACVRARLMEFARVSVHLCDVVRMQACFPGTVVPWGMFVCTAVGVRARSCAFVCECAFVHLMIRGPPVRCFSINVNS